LFQDIEVPTSQSEECVEEDSILKVNAGLVDILSVIEEWVKSSPEPTDDDVDYMLDFLNRLLAVKKIDKLAAVLRTIKM
jgi:hypothetical protein